MAVVTIPDLVRRPRVMRDFRTISMLVRLPTLYCYDLVVPDDTRLRLAICEMAAAESLPGLGQMK